MAIITYIVLLYSLLLFSGYTTIIQCMSIGDTLNVPDSITGLTILAAGTSLPEAVSSVLVTVQGKIL